MADSNRNIFWGESLKSQFAVCTYRLFKEKDWIDHTMVMAQWMGVDSKKIAISKCKYKGELSKAFSEVKKLIIEKLGPSSIEERGTIRHKQFRYACKDIDPDPLSDIFNAKTIEDLKNYWEFCQASSGLMPTPWLDYFFRNCQDLVEIKRKKTQGSLVISASVDRILTNIEYLPMLYEAIVAKQVLEIIYKPYEEDAVTLQFHPHFLKEYNGRWFLFGHADNRVPDEAYNLALDRIQSQPRILNKITFIPAPPMFYHNYFQNFVGVTHFEDNIVEHVVIRAHVLRGFMLTQTKPIHESQVTIKPFGDYEDGRYGEFSVDVELNYEFYSRLLQMGSDVEIVSPAKARNFMKNKILAMLNLYSEE